MKRGKLRQIYPHIQKTKEKPPKPAKELRGTPRVDIYIEPKLIIAEKS